MWGYREGGVIGMWAGDEWDIRGYMGAGGYDMGREDMGRLWEADMGGYGGGYRMIWCGYKKIWGIWKGYAGKYGG